MPTEAQPIKKRLVPAGKLCRNSIEKLTCLLDSRRLEVKDSEILDMALLVTRAETKIRYITRRINGRLICKNLGRWSIVFSRTSARKSAGVASTE